MERKCSLDNLPTEILRHIFESFAAVPVRARRNIEVPQFNLSREGKQALRNVSQTCRVLREVTQPLLFRHLCFSVQQPPDLELLSSLMPKKESPVGPGTRMGRRSRSQMEFLRTLAEHFGLQVTDGWLQPGIQRTRVLAMMVLLQVRHIHTLELRINIKRLLKFLPNGDVGFPTRYDALTDIRLGKNTWLTYDTKREEDPYSDVSGARRLLEPAPRRETVHLDWFAGCSNDEGLSAVDWSSVRNLSLQRLGARGDDDGGWTLRRIVSACQDLREVSIGLTGGEDDTEIDVLLQAMTEHRRALRAVDWSRFAGDQTNDLEEMARRCQNLEVVSLPDMRRSLWLIDGLPPSLRWLYIPDHGQTGYSSIPEWHAQLFHLVALLRMRVLELRNLPNFQGVVVSAFDCAHGWRCMSALQSELSMGLLQKSPLPIGDFDTDCDLAKNVRQESFMLLNAGLPCSVEFDDFRRKLEIWPGTLPGRNDPGLWWTLLMSKGEEGVMVRVVERTGSAVGDIVSWNMTKRFDSGLCGGATTESGRLQTLLQFMSSL
ncbi:hypothetical protein BDP81DRAFT_444784 [Colletotrichum phormii]|uniref:F-box domain-containing protein n=1 Tax=Colletotrichum phormii TaxID=359342 RepID=A0AAJ0EP88_9PEZI|nr:uncharacterized protein BDP81DRAFT_444784 [Colletotrichum phormii]KAK1656223.1 hypothetical protein BDP81DRAFT_444784 [Colletotrichum phormii]